MPLRHRLVILLVMLLSFSAVSAQSEFSPGDRVIFVAGSSSVYPSATSQQVNAGEISRGTVSRISAFDEASNRVYLIDSAFGWVDLISNGQPSIVPYEEI